MCRGHKNLRWCRPFCDACCVAGGVSQGLVEPLLAAVGGEDIAASADHTAARVEPVAAFFVLSRLCHSLTYQPLLTVLIDTLLSAPAKCGDASAHRRHLLRVITSCGEKSTAIAALCLLTTLANSRMADDKALGTCISEVGRCGCKLS